jgi:hypothetical protein
MSAIAWLIVVYLVCRMGWRIMREPKPDPTLGGRLVPRSPRLHAEIVAAHKAEHDAIVNGAWGAPFGDALARMVTVEEPLAHQIERRERERAARGRRALAMYAPVGYKLGTGT